MYIGSIKGNMGHAEAASGSAGLAKLLLMLQRKEIYPQASYFKTLNPRLQGLTGDALKIPTKVDHWNHAANQPRRALLNNFGAAGSNVAIILEEHVPLRLPRNEQRTRSSYVFNLTAKTQQALELLAQKCHEKVSSANAPPSLEDVCYSATARRQRHPHMVSMTCSSLEDLQTKLGNLDSTKATKLSTPGPVVFIMSGQGSIHPGMGSELMETSPAFRGTVRQCDLAIQSLGFPSITSYLTGDFDEDSPLSRQIAVSQCACVALEYALATMLISWGIVPSYIVGHR